MAAGWLLDEKGADPNSRIYHGYALLHTVSSLDMLNVLLDRDADPTVLSDDRFPPLMLYTRQVELVARMLQEPRVQATVNAQDRTQANTAPHRTCQHLWNPSASTASIVHLLFQASASPLSANKKGETPLTFTQKEVPSSVLQYRDPTHHAAIVVLLEQALIDAEKTSLLVKARRLVPPAPTPRRRLTSKAG
jgi:hypothetical protein